MRSTQNAGSARTSRPSNAYGLRSQTASAQRDDDREVEQIAQQLRQTSLLPQKTLSMKQLDDSATQSLEPRKPQARTISPTKLPVGSHLKSASVKESPFVPSLKAPSGHQRQSSLTKPSISRGQLRAEPMPSLNLKGTTFESGATNPAVPGRQISHMRTPSQSLQEPKFRSLKAPPRIASIGTKPTGKTDTQGQYPVKTEAQTHAIANVERQGFSTHQQRFSPKKQVKDAPPGQPTATSAPRASYSRENLESTLELLHLHLLHRDSAKVQEEWKSSAKISYQKQFESAAYLNAKLNEQDKDAAEQKNAMSIMAWGNATGTDTIERKIRVLSTVVEDAYSLTESNGKHSLAMQAFEHWYENAEEVQRHHLDNKGPVGTRVDIMEGLGDGWKAEIFSLQDRLLQDANNLLMLGEVQEQSDLSRCITVVSEMLQNMLEELEMVQFIEESMVEQERVWVQSSIDRLDFDLRGNSPVTPDSRGHGRTAR